MPMQVSASVPECLDPLMSALFLAHSPDPDDVFMWWPITGMIDPPRDAQTIEPARVISQPVLDTGRFSFMPIAADIAALNRRALSQGDLDITAISMFAWAHAREKYQLTCFGSSMGYGYGPKIVGRALSPSALASPVCYADEPGARSAGLEALLDPDALIAVPGTKTTAFLLLSLMLGDASKRLKCVELPFDHILDAVAAGKLAPDGRTITHGLLIHQSQLTFADLGLDLIADVGAWWLAQTNLPLPLGGNAIRRDLDFRHGAGSTAEVARILDRSIRYALNHREESLTYSMRFAPELTREQAEKYIQMYVNDLTVDAGPSGERAIQTLLTRAGAAGLCPPPGKVDMLRS